MWKASEQARQNIAALLAARKERPSDLAFALGKHRSWMTRFLRRQRHELQLKDLDKIASFFGIATYQLFQPGISRLTERRKGLDRRNGSDRRISRDARHAGDLERQARPQQEDGRHVAAFSNPLRTLVADFEQRLADLLSQSDAGGQTPSARSVQSTARPRRGTTGGPDAPSPRRKTG